MLHRMRFSTDPVVIYNPPLTEKEEVTLSWLQGRAKVGTKFELKQMSELLVDVYSPDVCSHRNIFMFLKALERKGYISTEKQEGRSHRLCVVHRTLEQARRNNND